MKTALRLKTRSSFADSADPNVEEKSAPEASASAPDSSAESPVNTEETALSTTRECSECQAKNELDARFCKACGKPIASAAEDNA